MTAQGITYTVADLEQLVRLHRDIRRARGEGEPTCREWTERAVTAGVSAKLRRRGFSFTADTLTNYSRD